ncbi:MAG: dTDP-4-dehydrorhamnose reductase [Candidatus Saelkia tenebricola]|nr:dTDP-4-dehydrorhamnose reductase [Candidatus Saelkia tenebricola]
MKILLTGATGMLGRDIRSELGDRHEIIALSLCGGEDTEVVDIRDELEVFKIITKHTPELIIHTAAVTDVDFCENDPGYAHEVNTVGTRNIVWSISESEHDITLIHISTDYVFDGEKDTPYTEEGTPSPLNIYGMSKLSAERYVSYFMEKYFILRTGLLYGEGEDNFVKNLFNKLKNNEEISLIKDQVLSPTSTSMFAEAVGMLLEKIVKIPEKDKAYFGIYNLVNSGKVSRYQIATKVSEYLGVSLGSIKNLSENDLSKLAPRPKYTALSMQKFQDFTETNIKNWEESLNQYLSIL